jgi:hypothetical protein
VWPFKKSAQSLPETLYFKDGEAFFEMQCKYGQTDLKKGQGVVALVLDSKKEFGTEAAIKVEADGRQLAMIRVAADDGGFIVPAYTPSKNGERLKPGDVVIWVPSIHNEEVAKGLGDNRAGWMGFIRAKIAPEMSTKDSNLRIICEYN